MWLPDLSRCCIVYQRARARLETHAQDAWFASPLASVVPRRQSATVRAGRQALRQEAHLPMRASGTDPAVDLQPAGWVLRTQHLLARQITGSMTQPTALKAAEHRGHVCRVAVSAANPTIREHQARHRLEHASVAGFDARTCAARPLARHWWGSLRSPPPCGIPGRRHRLRPGEAYAAGPSRGTRRLSAS